MIAEQLSSYPRIIKVTYKDGRDFTAKFAGFADAKTTLMFYGSPHAPAEVPISMIDFVEVVLQ